MIQILDMMNDCTSPALANILTIIKRVMAVIQILGPIIFLVALTIHLVNLFSNPDDKKLLKKVTNSAIAVIILFFIPIIVDFVMGVMDNNFSVSACWNSVSIKGTRETPTYVNPGQKTPSTIYENPEDYEKSK